MAEAYEDPLVEDEDEERKEPTSEEQLEKLAVTLATFRSEAIAGRTVTGIEEEWAEDEEYYEGIDDANRHEFGSRRLAKPMNRQTLGDENRNRNRGSTIFFNMTRAYVDAASARVSDMLLPTDDRGWAIKPTPVPELITMSKARPTPEMRAALKEDSTISEEMEVKELGNYARERFPLALRDQIDQANEQAGGDEQTRAAKFLELADNIGAQMDEANEKAERAQKRIEDWHVESQYHHHMRQVIEDAARIGTGVLKGPIPISKRHVAFKRKNEEDLESKPEILIEEVLQPASYRVDPWNCFPDPAAGESIHDGSYHWERADITKKGLLDLQLQPGYKADQIRKAVEEGAFRASGQWEASDKTEMLGCIRRDKSNLFEIWYGYVFLTEEDCKHCGTFGDEDEDFPEVGYISVCVTMVNNRIIKATRNILDTGEFPYDYMVWQRRSDMPYGIGVARQGRAAQRVINAAARNMMDNAGLAGGPMWAFLEEVMEPLDGIYEIRPRKGWVAKNTVDKELLQHAFQWFQMDMQTEELRSILEIGLKMFEDVTGLPMLLQGQTGDAPDTVGGMQMLNNNASSVMRRIAKLFDDRITEPHIRRYYAYLLQHGENDSEKGDFAIDARGSSALVERDISNQAIFAMAQMVLDPRFGKDPRKWIDEWLRSQKLDPKRFDYEDDEWKTIVEGLAAQAQKQDSSVEVANIRNEGAIAVQQLRNELEAARLAINTDEKAAENASRSENAERDRQMKIAFEAVKGALQKEIKDKETNSQVSQLLMKLEAQFMMQDSDHSHETAQLTAPPTEPPGRAKAGEAYQA